MLNKYYVGARHIGSAIACDRNANITRETIEEAIQEAKGRIRKGEADCLVVVEIKAIVRKVLPPVDVEMV